MNDDDWGISTTSNDCSQGKDASSKSGGGVDGKNVDNSSSVVDEWGASTENGFGGFGDISWDVSNVAGGSGENAGTGQIGSAEKSDSE